MDTNAVEIGIAAGIQLGAFLVLFGSMRADLQNIKGWLAKTAETAEAARLQAAETAARVEDLQCKTGRLKESA